MKAPDGKQSLVANYPQGSWNFKGRPLGGLSAYLSGPSSFNFAKAKEVVFGYSLLFENGFDFHKGGKLFGLCESSLWPCILGLCSNVM